MADENNKKIKKKKSGLVIFIIILAFIALFLISYAIGYRIGYNMTLNEGVLILNHFEGLI